MNKQQAENEIRFRIALLYLQKLYEDKLIDGGPEGTRTLYLFHAMEALSQVSYRPSEKII